MDKSRTPKSRFCELIKNARVQKGLSQLALAMRLGHTNGQYISNVERGLVLFPKNKVILQLSQILNISVADLVMARANDIIEEMEHNKLQTNSSESV